MGSPSRSLNEVVTDAPKDRKLDEKTVEAKKDEKSNEVGI